MSFNFDRRTFLKGAGAVGAASLLAACGEKSNNTGNGAAASGAAAPNSTGATPLKEFISFESGNRELESWNMLYSQRAEDANVVTNLWDGLLSFDCYGKVVPAIASSWEHNEDATVWTFHLRDDVDWVDCNGEVKAHLTSKDFLVGFEWVMNAIKNEANNTSMPNDTIVGAYEYYELTKEAGDAAADMTYEDMLAAGVGIEAPDDYTLVFTCPNACPYFDTVAAYTSFYPVAPALIEELGIDGFRGCDNTTMWYNGPYMVEEYIQGNTKSYIPNPNYYDAANVSRFERFTVTMISDGAISLQLYQNRELDEVDLGESSITTTCGTALGGPGHPALPNPPELPRSRERHAPRAVPRLQRQPRLAGAGESSTPPSALHGRAGRRPVALPSSTTTRRTPMAPPMRTGTRPLPTRPSVSASPRAWC